MRRVSSWSALGGADLLVSTPGALNMRRLGIDRHKQISMVSGVDEERQVIERGLTNSGS